jgi:uncharacterized YkwD family protein
LHAGHITYLQQKKNLGEFIVKKKLILSFAVASALWINGQMPAKTEAAEITPVVQKQVYVYQGQNVDVNKINSFLEQTLERLGYKNYINIAQPTQKAKAPAEQKKTAPKAPAKTEAPKAPAQPAAKAPAKPAPAPAKTEAPAPAKQQPAEKKPAAAPTSSALSAYEQQVVELTNQERAKAGLPSLKVDTELSKVAREKSRDMSANNYFDHNSPTYGSPFDMMKKFGISYTTAGENIAMGQRTPQEVVTAWMNSEGHRKNIMNGNFTHIGVGHVADGNYWTQQFIGK